MISIKFVALALVVVAASSCTAASLNGFFWRTNTAPAKDSIWKRDTNILNEHNEQNIQGKNVMMGSVFSGGFWDEAGGTKNVYNRGNSQNIQGKNVMVGGSFGAGDGGYGNKNVANIGNSQNIQGKNVLIGR